jgi:ketosteroid isomerase-like protein
LKVRAVAGPEAALSCAYAAVNRGDIETALALMCQDVDWPNTIEGGREHGRDAVRVYWTRLFGLLVPRFDVLGVRDAGRGRTVVQAHLRFSDPASGQPLAHQDVEHVFTWRGSRVARMDAFEPKPIEPPDPAQAARAM